MTLLPFLLIHEVVDKILHVKAGLEVGRIQPDVDPVWRRVLHICDRQSDIRWMADDEVLIGPKQLCCCSIASLDGLVSGEDVDRFNQILLNSCV